MRGLYSVTMPPRLGSGHRNTTTTTTLFVVVVIVAAWRGCCIAENSLTAGFNRSDATMTGGRLPPAVAAGFVFESPTQLDIRLGFTNYGDGGGNNAHIVRDGNHLQSRSRRRRRLGKRSLLSRRLGTLSSVSCGQTTRDVPSSITVERECTKSKDDVSGDCHFNLGKQMSGKK